MNRALKILGVVSGALSFTLCLAAGVWILVNMGLSERGLLDRENAIWTGLGLYFVGKALFVGPLLTITTLKA